MKQITSRSMEEGNSSVDLTGFTDGSCARVMKDFRGDDRVVAEHKKPEYYSQKHTNNEEQQQQRR